MRLYRNQYPGRDGKARRSRNWTYDFTIAGQRYKGSTGLSDQVAAHAYAMELFVEAQRRAAGMEVTPARSLRAPLDDVIATYQRELHARRRTAQHVREVGVRIRAVARGAGATTLRELADSRAIARGLEALRHLASKTVNEHRAAVHALFEWLVRKGDWPTNPSKSVARLRPLPTRRYRAFSDDEVRRLLAIGPGRAGLEGEWQRRRATYVLAVSSGLRAGECARLVRADIDLDAATVTLRQANAKSRREDLLPLPLDAVAELRPYLAPMLPTAQPFHRPDQRSFLRDLARAGIPRDTEEEGRVDFHSLRRTYSTRLARAGVPMAVHQKLMRHTDPRVTMSVYTRLQLVDGRAAARALEGLLGAEVSGGEAGVSKRAE